MIGSDLNSPGTVCKGRPELSSQAGNRSKFDIDLADRIPLLHIGRGAARRDNIEVHRNNSRAAEAGYSTDRGYSMERGHSTEGGRSTERGRGPDQNRSRMSVLMPHLQC
jgi:hypothetical protein